MSIVFSIYPALNLCRASYSGFLHASEPASAFAAYTKHPHFRPQQQQLFDLSAVTGAQLDLAALLELQKLKMSKLQPNGGRLKLVLFAPSPVSLVLARLLHRSWENQPAVVTIVEDCETHALRLLGVDERSFPALDKILV